VLLFAAVSWSVGSVYSKNARLPRNPILAAGMNLLCGGGVLLLVSVLGRETVVLSHVSLRSFVSIIYLIAFGSVIAFTAYLWLMRSVHPARVATYAYVNPVVAVFVGWLVGGESLNPGIVFSAALMALGVAIIITRGSTTRLSPNNTQSGGKIFRAIGLNLKNIDKEVT
jgi:drug/metabolite transporter (DMT)-like permease